MLDRSFVMHQHSFSDLVMSRVNPTSLWGMHHQLRDFLLNSAFYESQSVCVLSFLAYLNYVVTSLSCMNVCSEMGAHFSPCGKFLAACVACTLPHGEVDSGLQTPLHQDSGAASSPTRHPISAHQVMYELRIYSLEEAT